MHHRSSTTNGRRTLVTLTAVALAAVAVVNVSPARAATKTTTKKVVAAKTKYPLKFENCGFSETIKKRPSRVLLLNGSSFSESTTMAALGLQSTVVANGQVPMGVSDMPGIAEIVQKMPTGGLKTDQTTFEVTKESMLAAKPDLVISVWSGGFQGDYGVGMSREELRDLGIATYVSRGNCGYGTDFIEQPKIGVDASYQLIEDLGKIFDVQAKASALIAEQKKAIASVQAREAKRTKKVSTLVFNTRFASFWPNGVGSINTFPVTNAILDVAGATNAFSDYKVSKEQMVATQVDFLVIYLTDTTQTAEQQLDIVRKNFPDWNAVKNNAWVAVSDGIYFGATQHLAVQKIATALDAAYPIG